MLIAIFIICLHIYKKNKKKEVHENMINIEPVTNPTWNRNKCKYIMNNVMTDVLNDYNISKSNNENVDLMFPCLYNETSNEISQMKLSSNKNEKIFIINNGDQLVAKNLLWEHMVSHFGLNIASTMMPMTYILYNTSDLIRFKNEHVRNDIYIMKKNIQQQQGLKITNNCNDVVSGYKNGYVIVQKLLQDAYVIPDKTNDGIINRKLNMRYYILVICKNGNVDVFVHNNGFMYYTQDSFEKGTTDMSKNVTTGYFKDRSVYSRIPLTRHQFWDYLDDTKRNNLNKIEANLRNQKLKISNIVSDRIINLIKNVFLSMIGNICTQKNNAKCNKSSNIDGHVTFQLFGADIALNDEMYPTIMEVNKGPDLNSKDEKDKKIKYKVTSDIFRTIKIINDDDKNGFEKILDYHDGLINRD